MAPRQLYGFGWLAAVLLVLSGPAAAQTKKPAPQAAAIKPAGECRGVDMLAELATSDPETYATIVREAAATENTGAVLWKIERDKLPPSHLFGTMHTTDKRITQMPPKSRAALDRASTVVVEVADLSPAAGATALSEAMRFAVFTDGNSLEKLVSAEEFAKVTEAVVKAGLPAETARLLKPWIVSMLMSAAACEKKRIEKGDQVLDMRIAETAKRRKVPLIGLETAQSQLEALAAVPESQQVDLLRSSLPYASRTQDLAETVTQLYLKRNIGAAWPFQLALARKAGIASDAFSGFQQQIVNGRNARMRDNSLPHLAKGGAFIAVGALHLPGKTGLVTLFREAGYKVTAVE
ncbi:MAG: TraB/GumN family protein [Hyphomicrobium sp.]